MVPNASLLRIPDMVPTKLEWIADGGDGWETLLRDSADGRLWKRFYPHGERWICLDRSWQFLFARPDRIPSL